MAICGDKGGHTRQGFRTWKKSFSLFGCARLDVLQRKRSDRESAALRLKACDTDAERSHQNAAPNLGKGEERLSRPSPQCSKPCLTHSYRTRKAL